MAGVFSSPGGQTFPGAHLFVAPSSWVSKPSPLAISQAPTEPTPEIQGRCGVIFQQTRGDHDVPRGADAQATGMSTVATALNCRCGGFPKMGIITQNGWMASFHGKSVGGSPIFPETSMLSQQHRGISSNGPIFKPVLIWSHQNHALHRIRRKKTYGKTTGLYRPPLVIKTSKNRCRFSSNPGSLSQLCTRDSRECSGTGAWPSSESIEGKTADLLWFKHRKPQIPIFSVNMGGINMSKPYEISWVNHESTWLSSIQIAENQRTLWNMTPTIVGELHDDLNSSSTVTSSQWIGETAEMGPGPQSIAWSVAIAKWLNMVDITN